MVGKFKMPTTCVVVGCRRRWIAFVSRKNSDGSAWEPGNGDRICSEQLMYTKHPKEIQQIFTHHLHHSGETVGDL